MMRNLFVLTLVFGAYSVLAISPANAGKLAEKATMQRQLESVTDDDYLAERYFPLLLKHADSEKVPMGIVMMFALANADFEAKVLKGIPPIARVAIQMNLDSLIPQFIRAIFPNDASEAEEAIKIFAEVSS